MTNGIHKTLTKFNGAAFGGRFRKDGQLLCVGGEDGAVKVFDVNTKTLLRLLQHKRASGSGLGGLAGSAGSTTAATKCCDFLMNNKQVAGFSDNKSVTVWDVATEEVVANWDVHKVIIRILAFFKTK